MLRDDKKISVRINLFYKEIFDKYEKLNEENFDNLRDSIDKIFSSLKPIDYQKDEYKKQIDELLYPNISIVGLTNLFSKNKYTQYTFLIKVNSLIENELENNIHIKKKIK